MQIEWTNLENLKENPSNPNVHTDAQINRLAKNIKEIEFRVPIIVSKRSGYIVAGHGRLMAAQKAGLTKLPVIYQDFKDETEEYIFMTSDNGLAAWAELDFSLINDKIPELGPFDIDLLGILDFEIEPADKYAGQDPDAIPENVETICKPGDLWQLGSHRLLCGDSTNILDVERLMGGEKADMVFTDPPYGMNLNADYSGMINKDGVAGKAHKQVIGDDKDFDPGVIFGVFAECDEIILFGADYYAEKIPDRNLGSWLVWDKRTEEKYDKVIGSGFELLWSKKRRKREMIRFEYSSWGARMADNQHGHKPHPTMKPVGLLEIIIEKTEAQSIVDLFGGSGSILIACEKTNRKCFGMEIDPHYVDVIIKRWEDFTGQQAVKL